MTNRSLFPHLLREQANDPALKTNVAIADANTQLSYPELMDAVDLRAKQFAAVGFSRGQRIAFLYDREIDLIIGMLASLISGISFTVLSRREGVAEAGDKLAAAGFRALVVADSHGERGRAIANAAGIGAVAATDLESKTDESFALPNIEADDEAIIIFTSGSSGKPKAVRIGHGNVASNTAGVVSMTPIGVDDHLLHIMPLSHTNGILNQVLAPLCQGARITLLPRFEAEDFVRQMVALQPTIITGVPTIYQRLLAIDIPVAATTKLRMARCGSAPLAAETQKAIEKHLGVEVVVSYGQTETTCTNTSNPPGARRIGSVGRVLPGQDVAVLALDNDEVLAQGLTGEVAIRGPNIALGFVGGSPFDQSAWLRTGDSGHFDEAGYLFLTGRLKEIIIRGGENLSPVQIENLLLTQDGIQAACVCGVPDADLGEVPVAFLEMITGKAPDLGALNAAIADRLSPSHRLRDVYVVDTLPTNRVGKVDRKALEVEARSRCQQSQMSA